jgi:hypothetical protein
MGTREAPRVALRREVGAKKNYLSRALFSELLSSTVFIQPGAAGTRGTPGAALHQEAGVGAQRTHAGPGAVLS